MVETAGLLDKPLSGNFDIATVRAVFQVLSGDDCEKAARNIAAALPSGGEIFIIGSVLDDGGLTPEICVAHNVQFLNVFDDGETYRKAQYRDWLTNAGFIDIVRKPQAQGRSLMTARKA